MNESDNDNAAGNAGGNAGNNAGDNTGNAPSGAPPAGQVLLERLYLKDASFESPRSPALFTERWQPQFQVDINTRSDKLDDDRFEVVLAVTLNASSEDSRTAFIVEVQHAGVFQVKGLEPQARQRVLGTLCPGTLFPYVRETVDSLVVKGGFPAVQLAPVNFEALYADAVRRKAGDSVPH